MVCLCWLFGMLEGEWHWSTSSRPSVSLTEVTGLLIKMEIELHYPLTQTHTHTFSLSLTVSRACAQLACSAWHLHAEAKHWLHSPPCLCLYLSMSQRVNTRTHAHTLSYITWQWGRKTDKWLVVRTCIKTFKVNNSTAGKWLTQLNYTSLTLYRVKIIRQIRFVFFQMTDADIQKGLVGLEKLQIQNLKPLVTLLLFSIYLWFGGK